MERSENLEVSSRACTLMQGLARMLLRCCGDSTGLSRLVPIELDEAAQEKVEKLQGPYHTPRDTGKRQPVSA